MSTTVVAPRRDNTRSRRAARRAAELLQQELDGHAPVLSAWGEELTVDEINDIGGFIVTHYTWWC